MDASSAGASFRHGFATAEWTAIENAPDMSARDLERVYADRAADSKVVLAHLSSCHAVHKTACDDLDASSERVRQCQQRSYLAVRARYQELQAELDGAYQRSLLLLEANERQLCHPLAKQQLLHNEQQHALEGASEAIRAGLRARPRGRFLAEFGSLMANAREALTRSEAVRDYLPPARSSSSSSSSTHLATSELVRTPLLGASLHLAEEHGGGSGAGEGAGGGGAGGGGGGGDGGLAAAAEREECKPSTAAAVAAAAAAAAQASLAEVMRRSSCSSAGAGAHEEESDEAGDEDSTSDAEDEAKAHASDAGAEAAAAGEVATVSDSLRSVMESYNELRATYSGPTAVVSAASVAPPPPPEAAASLSLPAAPDWSTLEESLARPQLEVLDDTIQAKLARLSLLMSQS
jgi:hypothetical protein